MGIASGAVTYQSVAEPLRADAARAWAVGMADCVVASKVLAARLTAVGLRARARRGYLLSLVGSEHAWCELYEDGRWLALDPVFAFATSGRGGDPRFLDLPRFSRACLGTRFNRLPPCDAPNAGWPFAELDPVRRLRVMAGAAQATFADAVTQHTPEQVWFGGDRF